MPVMTSFIRHAALSYAKIMQTSGKRTCSLLSECSLSYAKIMQTSGKRACFQLSECSLSYAKIMQAAENSKTNKGFLRSSMKVNKIVTTS